MSTDTVPLVPGNFYHIYNRGNNRENLFPQERNYAYFLELWWKHIHPVAETWAYCLLRNHFHTAVYIRNLKDLTGPIVNLGQTPSDLRRDLSGLKPPSQYFSNFFNAYTRGVNIATERTGTLFARPFKRIPVGTERYLLLADPVYPSESPKTWVHIRLSQVALFFVPRTDRILANPTAKKSDDAPVWES